MQVRLAKEEKDNIVPLPRFLLLGNFDVGIAVRDEVNLDTTLVGLLKLLGPHFQILVRGGYEMIGLQHGHGARGGKERWRFCQQDAGQACCRSSRCFEYLPSI